MIFNFTRNQFGNLYIFSEESDGTGQRVGGDLDEEGVKIFFDYMFRGEKIIEITPKPDTEIPRE